MSSEGKEKGPEADCLEALNLYPWTVPTGSDLFC